MLLRTILCPFSLRQPSRSPSPEFASPPPEMVAKRYLHLLSLSSRIAPLTTVPCHNRAISTSANLQQANFQRSFILPVPTNSSARVEINKLRLRGSPVFILYRFKQISTDSCFNSHLVSYTFFVAISCHFPHSIFRNHNIKNFHCSILGILL